MGPAVAADQGPPRYIMMKINVADLPRATAFYTTFLDLKIAGRVDEADYAQSLLNYTGDNKDSVLILHFDKKKKPGEPVVMGNAFNNIALSVRDLDGIAKRLKAAGHPITQPLITMPAMLPYAKTVALGFTQDPDGFKIELVEWRP
jgi:catechol 2,3-dioxygenase-like lactoylglutathione lyase family enzyme